MLSLYLMRHGEAEAFAASDAERDLTERGRQEASLVAAWLAERLPAAPLICHSPYHRARQTAAELMRYFPAARYCESGELIPMGTPPAVAGELEQLGGDTLICVSHQPLVGELRNWLVEGNTGAGYPFATAGIALLECDYLAPGAARMQWIRTPSELD